MLRRISILAVRRRATSGVGQFELQTGEWLRVGCPDRPTARGAAAPLVLRPKSVTPGASTSGAGKRDAIIASPQLFFVY